MSKKSVNKLELYTNINSSELKLPLALSYLKAGFPSPAEDFKEDSIDLNRELIKNPSSTFFARVRGDSMVEMGIADGDLLIIDKSLEPKDGKIAVCFVDGEFTLKQISIRNNQIWLMPANPKYKPIVVTEENEFMIWGIVTYVIKKI